ncbi:triosephosphate isomerase [Gynuella sunshinyii YC6258]|uniref:Triosephosphate isomerase n=2 Tax=Gynuella sunshinyii TaxID=1445505 RepID=A0A0C5VD89_9GAMM|nr:triosephosphate isomerase [Gynuella sunshinyii YC6258]
MRRPMVAGNWKMNGDKALVQQLLGHFKSNIRAENADVVIFAPYPFLYQAEELLSASGIEWGAQNFYIEASGAFTGEVSLGMLKEFGCKYALVGHSERRTLFGETDEMCAAKVKAALGAGVIPVLCVGETLEQRESGVTEDVVGQQVKAVLELVGAEGIGQSVIAYEPVWAIGTGKTATPQQAQDVHAYIRKVVAEQNAEVAEKIQILYGGSVNASTAEELFAMTDIDGGLVGGASLKADDFVTICKAAE